MCFTNKPALLPCLTTVSAQNFTIDGFQVIMREFIQKNDVCVRVCNKNISNLEESTGIFIHFLIWVALIRLLHFHLILTQTNR